MQGDLLRYKTYWWQWSIAQNSALSLELVEQVYHNVRVKGTPVPEKPQSLPQLEPPTPQKPDKDNA